MAAIGRLHRFSPGRSLPPFVGLPAPRIGGFSARERRQIMENLGEHSGFPAKSPAKRSKKVTETEEKTLKGLNDVNFDDL
jgi:hypothetical protein